MPEIVDASDRKRSLDPTRSFIVQAPAGSGKTELLIQRYLRLLSGVERPEQILAMTFTTKAADEMKRRIINALESAKLSEPPVTPHELQTWELASEALKRDTSQGWRILENPVRMKILTIDSFCSGLTKQTPLLSGMGALLKVAENPDGLYRKAAHKILELVETDTDEGMAVVHILGRLDNSKQSFLTRIIQLLKNRDQWMIPFFQKDALTDDKRSYLETVLGNLVESVLRETEALFPPDIKKQLPALADYAGENIFQDNPEHELASLRGLASIPPASIENLRQWKAVASMFITKQGDLRKTVTKSNGFPAGDRGKKMKNNFLGMLESLGSDHNLITLLDETQKLPDPKFTDEDWEFLKSTFLLIPEMSKALRKIFIDNKVTDFTQIELSALQSLGEADNPSDLLLHLDMKVQHILVDEFQDTSYKQFQLLKLLTAGWTDGDGRTLFIVGDPMQSIYRFRDAEVGLFIQAREQGIGDIQLTSLKLKTNFRSQKKVVDWVNDCFAAIFPKIDDPDRGAIKYAPSIAAHPGSPEAGVVVHPFDESKDVEEAREITQLIQDLQKKHPGASIAILVRARAHLREIVERLHSAKIKFRAEEIDPLTARPAILDLLSLMRALLSHSDRVAWLSILRAPWCGLALKDLHQLCANDPATAIWELLTDTAKIARLSPDGQHRANRLTMTLTDVFSRHPQTNFRILLEACWMSLGGPACLGGGLAGSAIMDDTMVFFDKVEEVLISGETESLYDFETVLKNLYASPTAYSDDAVQIMTMHKAKGLEFDFVIIPGLGKKGMSDAKKLVLWMPHGSDILMAPMEGYGDDKSSAYNFIARLDKAKGYYEIFRLLYVSATRTKLQLHLFGHAQKKEDGYSPWKGSMLSHLWPYIEPEWNKKLREKPHATDIEEKEINARSNINRLPSDYKIPEPLPTIETGPAPEISVEEDGPPVFEWAGNKTRLLGNVLHQCFRDIAEQGLDKWDTARLDKYAPKIKSALLGQGLSSAETESACRQGMEALRNILDDATGRWILSDHLEARSEYGLTRADGKNFVSKKIDRTFVDENNARWIIDYKTSPHEGADMETFFQQEKERYRGKMNQYEEMVKSSGETRPIKKALYYPIQRRLVEY